MTVRSKPFCITLGLALAPPWPQSCFTPAVSCYRWAEEEGLDTGPQSRVCTKSIEMKSALRSGS